MPIDPQRVKALFQAAISLADHARRADFVAREAGDDAELRERLMDLLEGYEDPPEVFQSDRDSVDETVAATSAQPRTIADGPRKTDDLAETLATRETPAIDMGETRVIDPPPPGRAGDDHAPAFDTLIADRYRIRQEIGEGGMGSVYLADQIRPIKRRVALKLIKPGMDSRTVLARFEGERQALALMDHPNIARVLDAGTTEQGRPFFVMELVKGIPLTDYCDQHRLSLPERLKLFRQVCSAVQHAHQKGIIHRDLKPTNILVESHDGHPVPKVIDFGLAKAFGGMSLSDHTVCTAFGSTTGTPLYMAPEQAMFNALDVDTRVDIYALGVILYELLTGSTPIQRDSIRRAALDEMLRVIREVEPPTPSNRISTSEALPSLAANRHAEPARLSRLVKGDLDWIVMKALAKERARRYDSAIGLGNDVERYLNHEPVNAGPPGAAYRVRKFVRRNRGQVAAATLLLLALIGGVIGTSVGLREANLQRDLARDETRQKDIARQHEAEQRRLVEVKSRDLARRLGQMNKLNGMVCSIFDGVNPHAEMKDDKPLAVLLGERLIQMAHELDGELMGDPEDIVVMQDNLGFALMGLGQDTMAVTILSKVLTFKTSRWGANHSSTIGTRAGLGLAYMATDQLDRAIPLLQEVEAQAGELGSDHPIILNAKTNLARAYLNSGQINRAMSMLQEQLEMRSRKFGVDHPVTLDTKDNLASAYLKLKQMDRALPLIEEVLAAKVAKFGADHFYTLPTKKRLARACENSNQVNRAIVIRREVLSATEAKLGPDHADTIRVKCDLARAYLIANELGPSIAMSREALASSEAKLGPTNDRTLDAKYDLASAYLRSKQVDRAIPLLQDLLATRVARLGPDHADTLEIKKYLARAFVSSGQPGQSVTLLQQLLDVQTAKLGSEHPDRLHALNDLAAQMRDAGMPERSVPLLEESLALHRAKFGPGDLKTLETLTNLAETYQATGEADRALPLHREAVELWKRASSAPPWRHPFALESLGWCLLEMRQSVEAEAVIRESIRVGVDRPLIGWSGGDLKALLGWALFDQGRVVEAKPLLQAGYEEMNRQRRQVLPRWRRRMPDDLDRLIQACEATDDGPGAERWRGEKARLLAEMAPKPVAGVARP